MPKTTYSENNKNKKKKKNTKKKMLVRRIIVSILVVCLLVVSVIAGAVVGFVDNSMDLIAEEYNLDFTSIIYYVDSETNQAKELDRVHRNETASGLTLKMLPKIFPMLL